MSEQPSDVKIETVFRSVLATGSLKAFVDVQLLLPALGKVTIHDCSVVQSDGKPMFVGYPQKKGKSKYFPQISLHGPLHELVQKTVIEHYNSLPK